MNAVELYTEYVAFEINVKIYIENLIEQSDFKPKDYNFKAIAINSKYTDYVAIALINEKLVFLDKDGYQYDLSTISLEELLLVLEEREN